MGRRAQRKRSAARGGAIDSRRDRRDRERLARLLPGGTPERPIEIESPSQVEVIAAATPCPLCDAMLQPSAHEAMVHGAERLRIARTRCAACGAEGALYFRLRPTALH
jgi:hypothetical protein